MTDGGPTPLRGSETAGKTFYLPIDLQTSGTKDVNRHIRIAMAIVGETHALAIVEFNMHSLRLFMTKLSRPVQDADLLPGSAVCPISSVQSEPTGAR